MADLFVKRVISPDSEQYASLGRALQHVDSYPTHEGRVVIGNQPSLQKNAEGKTLVARPAFTAKNNLLFYPATVIINLDTVNVNYFNACRTLKSFICAAGPYHAEVAVVKGQGSNMQVLQTLTADSETPWVNGALYIFDFDVDGDYDIVLRQLAGQPINIFVNVTH